MGRSAPPRRLRVVSESCPRPLGTTAEDTESCPSSPGATTPSINVLRYSLHIRNPPSPQIVVFAVVKVRHGAPTRVTGAAQREFKVGLVDA